MLTQIEELNSCHIVQVDAFSNNTALLSQHHDKPHIHYSNQNPGPFVNTSHLDISKELGRATIE